MLKSARFKLALLNIDKTEVDQMIKNQSVNVNTKIYAPTSGYIFKKNIVNGSAFSKARELFQIINLDEVWIEVELFQDQIETLKNVEKYVVKLEGINESYSTNQSFLYPTKKHVNATFKLRLSVKNYNNKIVEGMYATIDSFEKSKEILTLPSNAVIRKNNKHYVFLVGDFKGEYEPFEVDVKGFQTKNMKSLVVF